MESLSELCMYVMNSSHTQNVDLRVESFENFLLGLSKETDLEELERTRFVAESIISDSTREKVLDLIESKIKDLQK